MSKESYKINRARACEIYGLDPEEVSCHHIVERSDVKGRYPKFPDPDFDVDQLSNLYPFKADKGTNSSEHQRTHKLIEATETKTIWSRKKKGRK